jgi:hypothetical protein
MNKHLTLLPKTLKRNPYFVELMDAADVVFSRLDEKVTEFKNVRNPYATDAHTEQKIARLEMLDVSDWQQPSMLKQQAAALGVPDENLISLWYLARYWRQKRRKVVEFTEFTSLQKWLTLLT